MSGFSSSHCRWLLSAGMIVLSLAAISVSARQASGSNGATQQAPDKAAPPPARLPWARGRNFATLDAYLAYLEQYNGPIDLPWWREIRPGIYQKMVRGPEVEPEIATRTELKDRWDFAS